MNETRMEPVDGPLAEGVGPEGPAPEQAAGVGATGPPKRGMPALAEALGYIGGALALAAVIAIVATFWQQIGVVGHIGIGVALAVAGLVGGFAMERMESPALKRLSHFLQVVGVAGVGVAAGFAVRDLTLLYAGLPAAKAAEWGWFAGAAGVAVSGGLVYLRHHGVLQHLAFALGVAGTALLALPLIPVDGPEWGVGATLVAVSLAWGAFSLSDMLKPEYEGLTLSALGIVIGLEMMALMQEPTVVWLLWLGAVGCAPLIWAGARLKHYAVLGIGTVGLTVFAGQLVGEYLGFGAGTALALIAIGLGALALAIRMMLRLTPETSQDRRVVSEAIAYLGVALALGGAGILLAESWEVLGVAGRILVPLVGCLAAYTGATFVGRSDANMARRLQQTLYAVGVLAGAITAAMVARPIAEQVFGAPTTDPDPAMSWTFLAGTVTAAVLGAVTWWFRKGALTQAAFYMFGIVGTVLASINFLPTDSVAVFRMIAAVLVAIGTLWATLGVVERLTPARTAMVLGCYTVLQGFQMMVAGAEGFVTWAALLAIAFSIFAIIMSVYVKRAILLAFGAVGIVTFSMATVMEEFGEQASAPVIMLIMGVVLIALAVGVAKIAPHVRRTPKPPQVTGGAAPSI